MRPGGYPRADAIHARLHLYDSLSDYDSRLSELIEYFGWETGHKADACRRWFFGDDVKQQRFLEAMGLSVWEYAVMHQYAQFNRFDPERPDMYWLYDEVVERLDRLGGRDLICRLRLRARADPVPGDVFVTTTLERDWTDELKEFYIRDAGDAAQAEQLWGDESGSWSTSASMSSGGRKHWRRCWCGGAEPGPTQPRLEFVAVDIGDDATRELEPIGSLDGSRSGRHRKREARRPHARGDAVVEVGARDAERVGEASWLGSEPAGDIGAAAGNLGVLLVLVGMTEASM